MRRMIPRDEQETIIRFSRCEDVATIWTCDSTMITKLENLLEHGEGYTLVRRDETSMKVAAPKVLIRLRSRKRHMTDEQKAQAAERMRAYWAKEEEDGDGTEDKGDRDEV